MRDERKRAVKNSAVSVSLSRPVLSPDELRLLPLTVRDTINNKAWCSIARLVLPAR